MHEEKLNNRKISIKKLVPFGFIKNKDGYIYKTYLMNNQMEMRVLVTEDGRLYTEVLDSISGEEYVLHRILGAEGSFVGHIKAEYESVIEKIAAHCCELDIFKIEGAKKVISYIGERYNCEPEYLWEKFPDNAIWRRKDNKKWYAVLLTVSARKIGFDSDDMIEILDLKARPEDIKCIVDNKKYFPGYHMNKVHWMTVCFNNTVPIEEIFQKIDDSYNLAAKHL